MEVYRKIIKSIQEEIVKRDDTFDVKLVKPILDKYLEYLLDALFHNAKINIYTVGVMKIKMYPLTYISKAISKGGVYSSIVPNWIFKTSLSWPEMTKQQFRFKTLKAMNNKFKKTTLDTPYIYKLIEAHEKNII